ncbi:MAG: metal ABC transporter permease [Tidjanibacter sp.]|nr:metal ABC transporter permease [Tidjanibacter sp.]
MNFLNNILEYEFIRNAVWAAILTGIVCGIIGTYIVSKRSVFLSGGITHASFGGIGLAYYFGINPLIGATLFAILSALGIEFASNKGKIREDSAIGIIWSLGMAIGIIFIYMTPGYAPSMMNYLFGNILTVTDTNITFLAIFAIALILIFIFMGRPIMYVAFDREFSKSRGVPVERISYFMATLTALAIVLCIRAVGIVLLISLLTVPTVIVNTRIKSFDKIMIWASAVAITGNLAGLYFSWLLNIPAGAATIFLLAIFLIAVKLLPLYRNIKGVGNPRKNREKDS